MEKSQKKEFIFGRQNLGGGKQYCKRKKEKKEKSEWRGEGGQTYSVAFVKRDVINDWENKLSIRKESDVDREKGA